MVARWVSVCQKECTSSSVSSLRVHAAEWVQCSLLISVIANLKADYQQEAERVELCLMELHLRKSFGR